MAGDLIQTPQTRWIQGAYESVRRDQMVTLFAEVVAAAGANRYTTFRQERTTAGYVVPAGKTLRITSLTYYANAAGQTFYLGDGTNDVGYNSAVEPAGAIRLDDVMTQGFGFFVALAANTYYSHNIHLSIPTGRYMSVSTYLASNRVECMIIGHEE